MVRFLWALGLLPCCFPPAGGQPSRGRRDHLAHVTDGCLGGDPARRAALKVVFLSTPRTGTRHFGAILRSWFGDDAWRNLGCARPGTPAIGWIHSRPIPAMVLLAPGSSKDGAAAAEGNPKGVCSGPGKRPSGAALRARYERLFARSAAAAGASADQQRAMIPLVTFVRDPVDHILSYFSQLHGWRYLVPTENEARAMKRQGEPAWAGRLRRFVNSGYMRNFQVAFLVGLRPPEVGWRRPGGRRSSRSSSGGRRAQSGPPPAAEEPWECHVTSPIGRAAEATEEDLEVLLSLIRSGQLLPGLTERYSASVVRLRSLILAPDRSADDASSEIDSMTVAGDRGSSSNNHPQGPACRASGSSSSSSSSSIGSGSRKDGGAGQQQAAGGGGSQCVDDTSSSDDAYKPRRVDTSKSFHGDRLDRSEVPRDILDAIAAQTALDRRLHAHVRALYAPRNDDRR